MYRSSPLRSIEVGQAKILTVKNAHDYTYGKPPVGINIPLLKSPEIAGKCQTPIRITFFPLKLPGFDWSRSVSPYFLHNARPRHLDYKPARHSSVNLWIGDFNIKETRWNTGFSSMARLSESWKAKGYLICDSKYLCECILIFVGERSGLGWFSNAKILWLSGSAWGPGEVVPKPHSRHGTKGAKAVNPRQCFLEKQTVSEICHKSCIPASVF